MSYKAETENVFLKGTSRGKNICGFVYMSRGMSASKMND
jgi:hypothetical protein